MKNGGVNLFLLTFIPFCIGWFGPVSKFIELIGWKVDLLGLLLITISMAGLGSGVLIYLNSNHGLSGWQITKYVGGLLLIGIVAWFVLSVYSLNIDLQRDIAEIRDVNSTLSSEIVKVKATGEYQKDFAGNLSSTLEVQSTEIYGLLETIQSYEFQVSDVPECETRDLPDKPCLWRVSTDRGDSYDLIAMWAYGSKVYSLVVLNFNRTPAGYKGPTQGGFFIPNIGSASPTDPQFPQDVYPYCTVFNQRPCIYLTQPLDTYVSISGQFYGISSAAGCIEFANYYWDENTERFVNIPEADLNGIILILPAPDPQYCDF